MKNKLKKLLSSKNAIRVSLFVLLLIWCTGFSLRVLFPASLFVKIFGPFIKKIYGEVCHQIKYKTFSISGHYFFVCARCTGIYTGALFTSFITIFINKKIKIKNTVLYVSVMPLMADVLGSTLKIYNYSKDIAFATGLFFGSVVFFYISAVLEKNIHFLFDTSKK